MTKQKPLKVGQTVFGAYKEVVKHTFPGILVLVVVNLLFPTLLTFLFSVFLFGMLYINSYAILTGNITPPLKELFTTVGKKYLPALGLTLAVIALCLFAFFGPAAPLGILPNDWLSFLFYFLVFDLLLVLLLASLFIAVAIYLSYTLLFFWVDDAPMLDSIRKSYHLVKGQWKRAALYIFLSNVLPAIVFLALPAIIICLIGISAGSSAANVIHSDITALLLFIITAAIVFPLQTILNIAYFHKLKVRTEAKKKIRKN